jgi:hypothetical protein
MQSAGERLAALGLQVRTIRALSDRKSPQFDLWQARDMFRQLKDQLRDEDREMSTVRGEARLTEGEQRWYKSAVHEAFAKFISPARINHPPEKWRGALLEAEDEIEWHLSNLKEAMKAAADRGKKK